MGKLTTSKANNITSPNGNSLAVFIEGETNVMKLKDVRGNVEDLDNYVNNTNIAYLYAISKETQTIPEAPDLLKISFNTLELNKNINLIDNEKIVFTEKGVYNFNLSFQAESSSPTNLSVFMLDNQDLIFWSTKIFYCDTKQDNYSYNITLNISGNESLSFGISSSFGINDLSSTQNIPSATLTINKIG